MAKIRDYAVTINVTTTASMVCEMPTHETGDLLVACVNKDGSSAFTTPSGWTAQQVQASAGSNGGIYTKRAASSSETVTFALTIESCMAVVISVKGCNGSTEADAISGSAKSGADDSTLPLTGVGMTPSHNNCLIIHALSTDTVSGPSVYPGWVQIFGGDCGGANSLCTSYTFQRTAAAITAPDHWAATTDDSRAFIIAIRDDGNDAEIPCYIAPGTTPSVLISPLVFSTTPDKGTWELTTNDITTLAGKTMGQVDALAGVDSGYNPFRAALRVSSTSSLTNLTASEMRFTAAVDLTAQSGVVFGTWKFLVPKDYLDIGRASQGGAFVMFADAENDYKAWVIAGQFSKTTDPSNRQNYAIQVQGSSNTSYDTSGTINWAAINDLYLGASGYYSAVSIEFSDLYLLNEVVLTGGGDTVPMVLDEVVSVINKGSGNIPLAQQTGAAVLLWSRIRFGGVDVFRSAINLSVFQFPTKADEVNYLDFHVDNNHMGIEFYGLSGDVFEFTNCVFTSASSYYWRFHASHSSGATLDFSGSTVVNATVTLRSTSDLDGVAFIDCSTFTQNSATLINCTFDNSKVTSAQPADAALISDSAFISAGTGYAIEIGGTAANITLNDVTFSGYAGTDGSTGNEAIFVNIASGTMSITISGGTTPSIRTAGATVTVIAGAVSATLTVTDSVGDPIQSAQTLVKASDGTGPFPFEEVVTIANSGTTATVTHTTHGMATADKVLIAGASHLANNGVFTITWISANSYSYTMGSTPGSNPTGTILSTYVALSGATDVNGQITMSRVFATDQPVTGIARKSSGTPFYKPGPVNGIIDSVTGATLSAVLVLDE